MRAMLPKKSGPALPSIPVDKLSQDVSELKHRMEKLALTLARSGKGMASVAFDPDLSRAFTMLTDAELDTDLAYDVIGSLVSPFPIAPYGPNLPSWCVSIPSSVHAERLPAWWPWWVRPALAKPRRW